MLPMRSAALATLLLSSCVFAADNPAALTFNHALTPRPPLSLSDSLREPSRNLPLAKPATPLSRPDAPAAAPKRSSPSRATRLPLVEPNPEIDYKIANVTPDPNTDFKMRVLRPTTPSEAPDPVDSATSPADKK